MKIAIVGLGNMGRSIAERLRAGGFHIVECERADDPNEKLRVCDAFVIAVKPQSFDELADSISIDLSHKLAISIMAGVKMKKIHSALKCARVVRAMPNLGVQLGAGVTGWIASDACSDENKDLVSEIFSSMGEDVELENEGMIDALTAVSGSGPAYFFYLAELLEEKARDFGFDEREARMLAEQTFIGAAKLLESGGKTAQQWREAVCSKGGTTEAAIRHLQENKFDEIFKDAVEMAKLRSSSGL